MIKGLAYLWTLLRHLDNSPWLGERGKDYRMKIQSKSPLNDTCQDWALVWITFRHLQSFLRDGAITSNEIVGSEKKKRMNKKKKRLLSYNQTGFLANYSCSIIVLFWKRHAWPSYPLEHLWARLCCVPFVLLPQRTSLTLRNIRCPLNCKHCPAASGWEKRKRRPGMWSEWMMLPLRSTSAKQVTHKCQYPGTEAKLAHAKCIVRTLPFGKCHAFPTLVFFCTGSLCPASSQVGASLSHIGEV